MKLNFFIAYLSSYWSFQYYWYYDHYYHLHVDTTSTISARKTFDKHDLDLHWERKVRKRKWKKTNKKENTLGKKIVRISKKRKLYIHENGNPNIGRVALERKQTKRCLEHLLLLADALPLPFFVLVQAILFLVLFSLLPSVTYWELLSLFHYARGDNLPFCILFLFSFSFFIFSFLFFLLFLLYCLHGLKTSL